MEKLYKCFYCDTIFKHSYIWETIQDSSTCPICHQEDTIKDYEEIINLKDKLHRRNMQIKDLKAQYKKLEQKPLRETFNGRSSDLNECDTEALGDLIKEGYTSGRLDSEEKKIYWELHFNVWSD